MTTSEMSTTMKMAFTRHLMAPAKRAEDEEPADWCTEVGCGVAERTRAR